MAAPSAAGPPIGESWRIPLEEGQAISAGWPEETGGRPRAVTWHWTATRTLDECNRLLGGAQAERKGLASAHYGVGRTLDEGIERYVGLDDRSWHAGKEQILRWDGRPMTRPAEKGSRTSIGIETVHFGYARRGWPSRDDWILAHSVDGSWAMRIAPWPEEQVELMAAVGREIVERWPHLGPRDHHGHHDLCPGYKVDPAGFPFARVLRRVYGDPTLPDPWTPSWSAAGRRRLLRQLGYAVSSSEAETWTDADRRALRRFQRDRGFVADGLWTTAMAWQAFDALDG